MEDLKQNFRNEVAAVSSIILQGVMQNFHRRLREYVDNKGHNLQEVNIVIKGLQDKVKLGNKSTQNCCTEVSYAYGAIVLH